MIWKLNWILSTRFAVRFPNYSNQGLKQLICYCLFQNPISLEILWTPEANVIYIDLSFVQIQCKLVRNCVGRRFKMSQSMQKVIWISHKIQMDKSCKIHTFSSCQSSCVETAETFFSVSLFIRITDHETYSLLETFCFTREKLLIFRTQISWERNSGF